MTKEEGKREKPIPEEKIKEVEKLAGKIKESKTVFVASIRNLPAAKYQKIKKNLRGKAEILVSKRSMVMRAIDSVNREGLKDLKSLVKADTCLMFSEVDAFELAGILIDSQTPANAKAGDVAPEDIRVEPGPTDLMPGPAISELGAVGLKVAVEDGKLAIKQPHTIAKEGDIIDAKMASVFAKLGIAPMKVGFIPVGAYDAQEDKVYREIRIDKEGALEELRSAIGKALGFAVSVSYTVKETISYLIGKAAMEEKALNKVYEEKSGAPAEEKKEEAKADESEVGGEEKPAETNEQQAQEESTTEKEGNE